MKIDRDTWGIAKAASKAGGHDNLIAGRLDLHRDGFGFVRPNERQRGGDDDVFIPPNEIHGAMQGDQVLVEMAPPRNDGRRLGRIVRVLTRKNPTIVGIFHYAKSDRAPGNYVTPFDERMNQQVMIPFDAEMPPLPAETASPHRGAG